jgi:hypothetical protein
MGIDGTRFVIAVSEMTAIFAAQNRDGSTLNENMRNAWDGIKLENSRSELSKSPIAVNYTLGVQGSTTPELLREKLPLIDWRNGSVNRFIWTVPSGYKDVGRSLPPDFSKWANRVRTLRDLGNKFTEPYYIGYSVEGAKVWDAWIDSLPEYEDGDLMGDGMRRAKPHALRLANQYAQLDERRLEGWKMALEPVHIHAAIEIVERSRASMQWYLGEGQAVTNSGGYSKSDVHKLTQMLAKAIESRGSASLTSTELSRAFSHLTTEQRNTMCLEFGMVPGREPEDGKTGSGRRATLWTKIK